MPATRIELDAAPLQVAIDRLTEFSWIVFTSQNAVRIFWDGLRAAGLDARALAGVRSRRSVRPPLTLCSRAAWRSTLLLIASSPRHCWMRCAGGATSRARASCTPRRKARETRCNSDFQELGSDRRARRPVPVGARRKRRRTTQGADEQGWRRSRHVHLGLVRHQLRGRRRTPILARRAPAASIGPVTSQAARAAGLDVVVEATESTIAGLVNAISDYIAGASSAPRALMTDRTGAPLVIATRASELALRQARQVQQALDARGVASELKTYRTSGDKHLDEPLARHRREGALHARARGGSREGQGSALRALAQGSPDGQSARPRSRRAAAARGPARRAHRELGRRR